MALSFTEKWLDAVKRKKSQLCLGLDPAEAGFRKEKAIAEGVDKLTWCLDIIAKTAPYIAGVKVNRQYVKDFSTPQMQRLTAAIHENGAIAIDDCKLTDIGESVKAGIYHTKQQGFDALTFCPFAGNLGEATDYAHEMGIGLINLVLMSNPDFKQIKYAEFGKYPAYLHYADLSAQNKADGIVIGAPSANNGISSDEIKQIAALYKEGVILMPGLGAQGGTADEMLNMFGQRVIINCGRDVIYAENPAEKAKALQDSLLGLSDLAA